MHVPGSQGVNDGLCGNTEIGGGAKFVLPETLTLSTAADP